MARRSGLRLAAGAGATVLALALCAPASAATVTGHIGCSTLSTGDWGFPVRVLQGDLRQLGLYGGRVSGWFGAPTATAVRAFQQKHGLPGTGTLDAATFSSLKQALGWGAGPAQGCGAGSGGSSSTSGTATGGSGQNSAGFGGNTGRPGNTSGSSGKPSGGSAGTSPASGASQQGTSGSIGAGTFVQGGGHPSISGLQVGGRIAGLTIVRIVHLTATAYGATAADNYPYGAVDAFGAPLRPGDVAVDPSVISLNTKMYVTGYSTPYLPAGGELAVARDTGGAIKGARIDMYINSTNESLINSFGIQHVTAYILQ